MVLDDDQKLYGAAPELEYLQEEARGSVSTDIDHDTPSDGEEEGYDFGDVSQEI